MINQLHWLTLAHLPGIGVPTIRRWLDHFTTTNVLFSATNADLTNAGLTPKQIHQLKNPNWKLMEKYFNWCQKNHCQLITINDPTYPPLLREIYDAPLLLYVSGDSSLLAQPQLAIVGARNPTITGRELAEDFAKQLTTAGLIITSGLAIGIDAASHRGALSAGKTIAVLGTGLQHIYPPSNRNLAAEVIANGALISEFPPDTPPKAKNFPLRNRIISGLSLGVLVVEAAVRSGSLITARCAVEQNREVFAIPGSIRNPLTRGCHQLIRQGAKLVETAADILEEFNLTSTHHQNSPLQNKVDLDPSLQRVLTLIGYEITAFDVIIGRAGLTAGEVSSMLLSLELMGYVHAVPGGYARSSKII